MFALWFINPFSKYHIQLYIQGVNIDNSILKLYYEVENLEVQYDQFSDLVSHNNILKISNTNTHNSKPNNQLLKSKFYKVWRN